MLDKNKTPKTHRATAIVSAYLDARGFKPIETEVRVYNGWIADLASFVYPTMTETKKLKLTGYKNILGEAKIEFNDFIYRYSTPLTAIVEVKVTRQDFKIDMERKFSGQIFPAHLCYLAYPRGIIEEPPVGWVGLELDKECQRLLRVTRSVLKRNKYNYTFVHPQNPGDTIDLIANVAIRREHRTRYQAMRDWLKSYRAKEKQDQKVSDVSELLYWIEKILDGKTRKTETILQSFYFPKRWENIKERLDNIFHKLLEIKAATNEREVVTDDNKEI